MSRPLALIRGDSRFGIGPAGEPAGLYLPHVGGHRLGFFLLRGCIGLGVLLRQLTRMHHHKAPLLLRDAAIAVFDFHLAAHTAAMPAPGRLVLRPPGFLPQQGPGGLRAPPGFAFLPDSTRARDKRDESDLVLKTYTPGTTTIGFPIGDDATPPFQTSG
jgi:hypothetical protein